MPVSRQTESLGLTSGVGRLFTQTKPVLDSIIALHQFVDSMKEVGEEVRKSLAGLTL